MNRLLEEAHQARDSGDWQQAWGLYSRVLQQQPEHPDALGNLGAIALLTGYVDQAIELLQRAVARDKNNRQWQEALAGAWQRDGRIDKALPLLERILRQATDDPALHIRMADLLAETGLGAEAAGHYEKALRLDPRTADAWFGLASLAIGGDYRFSKANIRQLGELISDRELPAGQLARLYFALGNVLHAARDYATAFRHFQQANRLRKSSRPRQAQFDAQVETRKFELIEAAFTRDLIANKSLTSTDSELPVFIVGMPRTGSSLIERIIGSHSRVQTRGELPYIRNLVRSGLPARSGKPYPQLLGQIDQTTLHEAAQWYLDRLRPDDHSIIRISDKMPLNYELLGLIYLMFPKARVIHTIRDPLDTLWSCYRHDLNVPASNDIDDLVLTYRLYRRYMQLWRERLPLRILDLHYEELVQDPEQQIPRLIEFLGLDWEPDCLRHHEKPGHTGTASRTQAGKAIYRGSVQGWKKYARQLASWRARLAEFDKDGFGSG